MSHARRSRSHAQGDALGGLMQATMRRQGRRVAALVALMALAGCATRPINPPIAQADPDVGYRFATRQPPLEKPDTLVILAFSGGGTRAAAFSYGVLEFLRRTEIVRANGDKVRLIDAVGVITGVSGGSFTALAYGLYGDELFASYEQRFLKRDVQGQIIARAFNPVYWGKLGSSNWGRSELAADLYDEILFDGATFADLGRAKGPLILASATDVSTGARMVFDQDVFDALCSNLDDLRLSRAAAASSAVPVVLSAVTLNNYGGTCNYVVPAALQLLSGPAAPPRTAERVKREVNERLAFADSARRPYIHLVDGGVADNVGMRSAIAALESMEALHRAGVPTRLDNLQPHRGLRRQLGDCAPYPLGRVGEPAGPDQPDAAGIRGADRTLFLRIGGGGARQGGALAIAASHSQFARVRGQHESGNCRRSQGPRRRNQCHRCVVCGAQGQGRIRVPERAAHELRAAR